jgi:MFS family permease
MSARQTATAHDNALSRSQWFATIAGMSGSFVTIGLARFAYTPLIPSLIERQWFTPSDAVTLGAANLAGYLAGAQLGRPVAVSLSNRTSLRLFMVMATLALFACAFPLSTTRRERLRTRRWSQVCVSAFGYLRKAPLVNGIIVVPADLRW